jgi:hypothetical protein
MPAKKAVSTPVATQGKRALRLHGTIARDIGTRIVSGRISPGREAIAARDPKAAANAMTDLIQLALLDTSRRHGKPTRAKRGARRA